MLTGAATFGQHATTRDELHVQKFAELTDEFIALLDRIEAIRVPACRLTLVGDLQRIYEEARQMHEEHEADLLTRQG